MDHFGNDASDYDAPDLRDVMDDNRPSWADAYEPPLSPAAARAAMEAGAAGGWGLLAPA